MPSGPARHEGVVLRTPSRSHAHPWAVLSPSPWPASLGTQQLSGLLPHQTLGTLAWGTGRPLLSTEGAWVAGSTQRLAPCPLKPEPLGLLAHRATSSGALGLASGPD